MVAERKRRRGVLLLRISCIPEGKENECSTPRTGFLSKEGEKSEKNIHAYLDSGANAHLFKTKHAFEKMENKKISLITACLEKDKNKKASVGKTKNLRFYNEQELAIDKNTEGIFSEELVENLVSVGKICDTDQTVVFDQYGYMIFKGQVHATGNRLYAQNRDPQTGLYPIVLTTEKTRDLTENFPGERSFWYPR